MSYSPRTGLVYLPAQEAGFLYVAEKKFSPKELAFNAGIDAAAASLPQDAEIKKAIMASLKGYLTAWDPVNQKEVWRVQHQGPWNGGVLSTAGNLVVQGIATGDFAIYRADTGEKLWSMPVQTGVVAPPVSYAVKGEQYIAVLAGWGGVFATTPGELSKKSGATRNISRVLAFKLGGKASLPPPPPLAEPPELTPPAQTADGATVEAGKALYHSFCVTCHGDAAASGGLVPDLRYSAFLEGEVWFDIVLGGTLEEAGMISFAKNLDRDQVSAIRAYVIERAHQTKAELELAHEPE
ncbi:MAG: c-type cytochrome, partial [Sphingomonadales bacterium]